MTTNKIYGGIYQSGPSKDTDMFIMDEKMIAVENKLVVFYLWETIAHNLMLAKLDLIPKKASLKILSALKTLLEKSKKELFIQPTIGDVHENIEYLLFQMIGDEAGWFHIARSRNDQTATDQKLFVKINLLDLFTKLSNLEQLLLNKSELYKDFVMPGFTHLRSAMPSSFGFWWQAYLDQILDVHTVMKAVFDISDTCPLGAGASYGVNWKIDPKYTAQTLGFTKPFANALSAINSRGIGDAFVISNLAVLFVILSRMMEDIIIWSMPELGYISFSEKYTTGSSIMPQKINPDIAEKVRSKCALIIAELNRVFIAMKGTSSGYNRDSSESKLAIIDSIEESIKTISILCKMLETVTPNKVNMKKAVISSLPTKLADELVKAFSFPFRQAHKIIGRAVMLAQKNVSKLDAKVINTAIKEITGKKITVKQVFVDTVFNPNQALHSYQHAGSPNPEFMMKMNQKLFEKMTTLKKWTKQQQIKQEGIETDLIDEINIYVNNVPLKQNDRKT